MLGAFSTSSFAQQRHGQRVLHERLVQVGDHLRGGGGQAGEQVGHAGLNVNPGPGLWHGPLGKVPRTPTPTV